MPILPSGRTAVQDLPEQLFDAALKILFSVTFDGKFGPHFDVMVPDLAHFRQFLEHTRCLSSWLIWIQGHVRAALYDDNPAPQIVYRSLLNFGMRMQWRWTLENSIWTVWALRISHCVV